MAISQGVQADRRRTAFCRHRQQQNSHHRVRFSIANFNDLVRGSEGLPYGRRMYEVKRYWDVPLPPLRQIKLDAIGEDAVRLTYVPA
jgi:hypothetical protein